MDGGVPAQPVPGFQVLRVLDQDGTAVVYMAVDPGHRQAVLTVGHQPLVDPMRTEFASWAGRLAAVAASQPCLADVAGHGVTAHGRPYLAVRAGADTLASRLRAGGALAAEEARLIGVALAYGLAALHGAGLVHGVVRPSTVLLDPAAGPMLAGLDSAAPYLGAPFLPSAFTPPELLPGSGAPLVMTPAADVYDLAATLYTAVGGRVPWASDDGSGIADLALRGLPLPDVPGVSEGFTAMLRAALAVDPRQRPTAAALATSFQAVSAAAPGPPLTGRVLPVAAAMLTGVGARPVADAIASLGGTAATTATHAGVGAAAGYQTAAATAPIAGTVYPAGSGMLGGGVSGAGMGAGSGSASASGIGAAKVVVIAVLAAVVGAGAVVAYNVIGGDSSRPDAASTTAAPSSQPSSESPPSESPAPSPSPTGPDGTVRGAARTLEEYMHAMGSGDSAGVCKIAAYEFMKQYGGSYDSNVSRCRNEFSMIYGGIMSTSDKTAMRSARVDPGKIRTVGSNRVVVPRSAVTFSHSTKFIEEGWPVTMVFNGRHWYPVET